MQLKQKEFTNTESQSVATKQFKNLQLKSNGIPPSIIQRYSSYYDRDGSIPNGTQTIPYAAREQGELFKESDQYYKNKIAEEAKEKILENKDTILMYAEQYGVDPAIVAGCIYQEQTTNVNLTDAFDPLAAELGQDVSLGLGQVKISTAEELETLGYVPDVEKDDTINNLKADDTNIQYVTAYLKYHMDQWDGQFPNIENSPEILGTLYNIGSREPHANPKPNDFGNGVLANQQMLNDLLAIETE